MEGSTSPHPRKPSKEPRAVWSRRFGRTGRKSLLPRARFRMFGYLRPVSSAGGLGSVGGRNAARDHVDEILEVPCGPALEGAVAVALVGGHHRVSVVPVEAGLGVEPEEATGALGDLGEDLGVRL